MQVYLNGSIMDESEAAIPVNDRGFLFADGVYEVIRLYGRQPFRAEPHFRRMLDGLDALRIDRSAVDELRAALPGIVAANDVGDDGIVYMQVTRGVAPRKHAFPAGSVKPTVYMFAKSFAQYPSDWFERGVAAITVPDTRWSRCDIKSIALLPNVLANQQAHERGAFEALFVRDGVIIEGSHSNLFAVLDDTLITYPACNYVLPGITRTLILEMAAELGIAAAEAPLYVDRLADVSELFVSGTTTEIMPIRTLDGQPVGDGARGRVTRQLQHALAERVQALQAAGSAA